jgi:hypothetical protein
VIEIARIRKKWNNMLKETPHNQEQMKRRKRLGKDVKKHEEKTSRKGTRNEELERANRKRHKRSTLEKRDNEKRKKTYEQKILKEIRIALKNRTNASKV